MIFEPRAAAIIYNLLKSYKEDKVFLLPANVCPIVPITFLKAGKRYELIDISNKTLCMDEDIAINRLKLAPNTYAGVFFVRTFGLKDSFERFFREIKNINGDFLIIDDQCLSVPSYFCETNADVVLHSTGYSKIVDLGYGGLAQIKPDVIYNKYMLNYDRESHDQLVKQYKDNIKNNTIFHYHDSDWLDNTEVGFSLEEYLRLIEQEYEKSISLKNKINNIYAENLPPDIQLDAKFQMWRFNIRTSKRDEILRDLVANKLFASSHYASLKGIFSFGRAPNTENLYSNIINLFNDKNYDEEKAYRTVEIISTHLK